MIAAIPNIEDLLTRIHNLDEKIKYAEKQYTASLTDGSADHVVKRLKLRLNNLKKEKCLYHEPMQKLKPFATYQSYLYNKIESVSQFNTSRYL